MDRREALTKLMAGPFAAAGVQQCVELPSDGKVLLLSFDANAELEVKETSRLVEQGLREAGLGHLKVILFQGLQLAAVVK